MLHHKNMRRKSNKKNNRLNFVLNLIQLLIIVGWIVLGSIIVYDMFYRTPL